MSKLALIRIDTNEIVEVFPASKGKVDLPGVGDVSPPVAGWSDHGFKIVAVSAFNVPEGERINGDFRYSYSKNVVVEHASTSKVEPQTIAQRFAVIGITKDDAAAVREFFGITNGS